MIHSRVCERYTHVVPTVGLAVDTTTDDGFTALHEAAANGHQSLVFLLVEAGANTELQNRKGVFATSHR